VPSAPNVMTTKEAGLPDLQTENWYGMVGPPNLPAPILAALNKAAVDAMKDPDVIAKLSEQGATLVGDTPEHFRAYIASETKKWADVIKDAGVPVAK
ncbi:Bug family tripartite tricarboxylate transporter substrate binding protein, partial [Pararhizobium sp.]|uniref:Bug family tripartite tricarboxylate transporter substrate binding protein n=1 Tax=Pararhizobium sp. TaxID=1977563 RepID=UPI00271B12D9